MTIVDIYMKSGEMHRVKLNFEMSIEQLGRELERGSTTSNYVIIGNILINMDQVEVIKIVY